MGLNFRLVLCYEENFGRFSPSLLFLSLWQFHVVAFLDSSFENLARLLRKSLQVRGGPPMTMEIFHSQASVQEASSNLSKILFKCSYHLIESSGFCFKETNLSGFILWMCLTLQFTEWLYACVLHSVMCPNHQATFLKRPFLIILQKKKFHNIKNLITKVFF